jgi:GNAT superfamily N-acetyltransferase
MTRLIARPYREEDYWRIRAFVRELLPLYDMRQRCWDVARWDYWRWHGVENIEHVNLEDVVTLWETPRGKLAAMLNPEGMGEAFLQVHPDFKTPELEAEMIATAEGQLNEKGRDGRRRLSVWANQHDELRKQLLAQSGYAPGDWPEYQRRRRLDGLIPESNTPPGYSIVPQGDGAQLLERCYASGLAFHPNRPEIAMDNRADIGWYRNIQRAPLYRRDLDLTMLAADGGCAAFCTVWFDDVTRVGVFEPVATVPAHQRKGLGKALMFAGLRRLQTLGATMAYVGSYSEAAGALYASAGFTDYELCERWEKSGF